jgi:hypothetical protein
MRSLLNPDPFEANGMPPTYGSMHWCPVPEISMPFAADQLAVFQGGPSRTGGSDEHI